MKKKIDINVFNKYLEGDYSSDEYQQVKNWFEEEEYTEQLEKLIYNTWIEFEEQSPKKDLAFILHKIQSQIYKNEKKQNKTFWQYYKQIAAILMFPILLFAAYYMLNYKNTGSMNKQHLASWAEVYSPYGARTQFMLPDGTTGWLNGGSSIRYNVQFFDRSVKMIGEAFFNVPHKTGKNFVVKTDIMDITVMGTEFNVQAFPDDDHVEVVLKQGKVKIDGTNYSFSASLSPGERFVLLSNEKKGLISKVDANLYSSWKEGKLIFRDELFSDVLKKLGRWYNVSFDVRDEQIKNYRYQATFQDETLEEVLKLLSYTVPIKYEILDRKLNADNSFQMKKINIWKKNN